jgi:anti-anti-sigma regulatory factor
MTLRITASSDGATKTIRAEGRLDSATVPDLLAECDGTGPPLRLDLSGLRSVDASGVEALRSLASKGAELSGASAYIRQRLCGDGLSSSASTD